MQLQIWEIKVWEDLEVETIKNNEMLIDLVVNRCLEILKSQYRKRYKLQELGQKLMFKEKKENLFKYQLTKATTCLL